MIFALADCSPTIEVKHLRAALALWEYCEASARILFSAGDSLSDKIRKAIAAKQGITKTELYAVASHTPAIQLDALLSDLEQRGVIRSEQQNKAMAFYSANGATAGKFGKYLTPASSPTTAFVYSSEVEAVPLPATSVAALGSPANPPTSDEDAPADADDPDEDDWFDRMLMAEIDALPF